jgi:hypothetical protein
MKMLVAGVQRIAGTSKTGSAFDMCNVTCLVPVEAMNNGKITISGTGFKIMEVPLDAGAMAQFSGVKFPVVLDLDTEPRPRNGKVETVVTGINASLAKAA